MFEIIESSKARRFVWIMSLTLGAVVYCIMHLTLPGTLNIEAVSNHLIELLISITVYWAAGFVLVWTVHGLTKFMLKYVPFP
jgi:hypothetical protein